MEGYGRRLSELVLRGMDSEVLGCRVSSTVVCVEVRNWVWRRDGLGRVVGDPRSLGRLISGAGAQALRGIGVQGAGERPSFVCSFTHSFLLHMSSSGPLGERGSDAACALQVAAE